MTNRKNHNSIVFLTTLYLGLVLVGAPQALSLAALTKNFDIQNEIEVKDDLDNKPDNEEIEIFSKDDFPALFAQLLIEIREEVKSSKISLPLQTEFYTSGNLHRSESAGGGGGGGSIGSSVSDKNLSLLFQNAINQKFRPKAFELADFDSQNSKSVKINLKASSADLSLQISFGKSNAEQFADFLNQQFSTSAALVKNKLTKEIYENTKATSENNQVFVITRLPRGSLDALLNKGAN